jgi:AcrR family transcriptional regulator
VSEEYAKMQDDSPMRRRQNRKPSRIAVERRRNLIDAAIRNIAAKGYDAVTVATICEEAGFSRGLIGHYFASKEQLLLESVKAVAERLGTAIRAAVDAAGSDPRARLHALIKASFTPPGFTPENVAVWVVLTGNAGWSPQLASIYREIWRNYRAGVGSLFQRAAALHRIDLDRDRTALAFSQMVEGLWVGWAADPEAISPEKAAACCHSYVDMTLRTDALQGPIRAGSRKLDKTGGRTSSARTPKERPSLRRSLRKR